MFAKLLTAVIDFDDTVYRNIHTVIPSEDLLDDLSGDPGERAYGEALVSRQREESDYDSLIDRPFRYGVAITPGGICPGINSRFSDGTAFPDFSPAPWPSRRLPPLSRGCWMPLMPSPP